MTLYNKSGCCIIPKGTKLYKGGEPSEYDGCMFFGLQKYVAKAFQNNSDKIQVWTTKQDIKVLFMVSELDKRSWTKSSISEIYSEFYPSEKELSDLEIKQSDHQKRDQFFQKLKSENIVG